MDTLFLTANEEGIAKAAETIRNGGLCALPTETVYGLGANGFDATAVKNIFAAKGRPQDNPLILHIADFTMLEELVEELPPLAQKMADAFWPGPLTMILKRKPCVPDVVTAGLDTVAIRMPADPVMQAVIRQAGVPIAAPSANRSGKPSPTTAKHVLDDMDGRIDLILDGGACEIGLESTIVNLASTPPALLRPGGITLEQLRMISCDIIIDPALMGVATETPLAPGMKYRHYAPEGAVTVVDGEKEKVVAYIKNAIQKAETKTAIIAPDGYFLETDADLVLSLGDSATSAAQRLFAALRACDDAGVKRIYAVDCGTKGIGLALCNRLYKAAGFQIIDLEEDL